LKKKKRERTKHKQRKGEPVGIVDYRNTLDALKLAKQEGKKIKEHLNLFPAGVWAKTWSTQRP
jgi:hypothetical protein